MPLRGHEVIDLFHRLWRDDLSNAGIGLEKDPYQMQ